MRRTGLPSPGAVLRVACILALGAAFAPPPAQSQTFRLGPFYMTAIGRLDVGYDSNVDDLATLAEKEGYQRDDFYWMPGLTLQSAPVAMSPSTTLGLSAGLAYQDYFVRNDLDTETYRVAVNFNTAHPRLTLNGLASAEYSVEGMEHMYVPGGSRRDPMLTQQGNLQADWNYRKLRLQGRTSFKRERHDLEEFWAGDNDENILFAGVFLDNLLKLNLYATWEKTDTTFILNDLTTEETVLNAGAIWNLFRWGGLYYDWERTWTTIRPPGTETVDTKSTFGIQGAIPVDLLRRPKVTYAFGYQYEEETDDDGNVTKTWEPVHTITVSDEYQISKSVLLTGNAIWTSDVDKDEIEFQYNLRLAQQLGPRAQHAVSFTQEPRSTFGSNKDTKTTTYAYNLGIRDLIIYNLSFNFGLIYEENTPLDVPDARTEETTTVTTGLSHTRQLSRKLDRTLSYQYSWEDSNFFDLGVIEKHLVIYGLTYRF